MSWFYGPSDCRAAYHYGGNPGNDDDIGFRVLLSAFRTP